MCVHACTRPCLEACVVVGSVGVQMHAFWQAIWQETHQIAISGYLCEGMRRGGWDKGRNFTFPPQHASLVLELHNEHIFRGTTYNLKKMLMHIAMICLTDIYSEEPGFWLSVVGTKR